MDEWNRTPTGGTQWRLYVIVGFLALVTLVVAVAYALSQGAPSP